MRCDRCGNHHGIVWFAPSDIWNEVMRPGYLAGDDLYGFCCPNCFMQLAESEMPRHPGWMVIPFPHGPVDRADQITFTPAAAPGEAHE